MCPRAMICLLLTAATTVAAVSAPSKPDPPAAQARKRAAEARARLDKAAIARPVCVAIQSTPVARVEATWSQEISLGDDYQAERWAIYAAKAPDLPSQREVSSSMSPAPAEVSESGGARRTCFVARFAPANKAQRSAATVRVTYKATLLSRRLVASSGPASKQQQRNDQDRAGTALEHTGKMPVPHAPPVPALTKAQRSEALAFTKQLDFEAPQFQQWLDKCGLRVAGGETELEFAFRAFKWIRQNGTYQYKPGMDRQASRVCRALASDCDGFSGLLVCVLRANDIPARMLCGRWAKSSQPGQTKDEMEYFQEHVKAEFFAQGVGWVPADVTARIGLDKSLRPGLMGSWRDGFGQDSGDFLTLHVDGPFTVQPFPGQKLEAHLQGIAYWATGRGAFQDKVANRKWEVKTTRPEAATRGRGK